MSLPSLRVCILAIQRSSVLGDVEARAALCGLALTSEDEDSLILQRTDFFD